MPAKKYFTEEERKAARYASKMKHRKLHPRSRKGESSRYYKKNRTKIRAKAKERYLADPGSHIAMSVEYTRKNPEKSKARRKRYSQKNPDVIRAISMRYYHRKKSTTHPDIDEKIVTEIIRDNRMLSEATGIPHQVDHIIPLSRGGWHHHDNLQPLARPLNCPGGKGPNPFWLAPHMGIKDWRDVPRNLWPVDLVPKYLALIEQHKAETIRWDLAA